MRPLIGFLGLVGSILNVSSLIGAGASWSAASSLTCTYTRLGAGSPRSRTDRVLAKQSCPVAHERAVFDPVRLFRQVALGLGHELLDSPSLWLCLGCQACTAACAQGVAGHRVIDALQAAALRAGRVPEELRERLWAFEQAVYPVFLERLGGLLGG